jgi:ABC-type phosphate transport system permease subunit
LCFSNVVAGKSTTTIREKRKRNNHIFAYAVLITSSLPAFLLKEVKAILFEIALEHIQKRKANQILTERKVHVDSTKYAGTFPAKMSGGLHFVIN